MKLEFLDKIDIEGLYTGEVAEQLVRLYDFNKAEAILFRDAIQKYLIEEKGELNLENLPFINRINCELRLGISDEDEGIYTYNNKNFICDLSIEGYKRMLYLIEPFCNKERSGYQWLYELDVPIDFLFTAGQGEE